MQGRAATFLLFLNQFSSWLYGVVAYQASLVEPWFEFWPETVAYSGAKIPMARSIELDTSPKRTKKVRLLDI